MSWQSFYDEIRNVWRYLEMGFKLLWYNDYSFLLIWIYKFFEDLSSENKEDKAWKKVFCKRSLM